MIKRNVDCLNIYMYWHLTQCIMYWHLCFSSFNQRFITPLVRENIKSAFYVWLKYEIFFEDNYWRTNNFLKIIYRTRSEREREKMNKNKWQARKRRVFGDLVYRRMLRMSRQSHKHYVAGKSGGKHILIKTIQKRRDTINGDILATRSP